MMVTIWLMMVNNRYGAWGKKTSSKPPSRIGFDPSLQRKCFPGPLGVPDMSKVLKFRFIAKPSKLSPRIPSLARDSVG